MDLRLPHGLTSRPASRDDVDAITGLIAACELDLDGEAEIDGGDVETSFGRPGYDPARDCLIVHERELLVGWAEAYRTRAEVHVHPSRRGLGIGAALLGWTEARARETGQPSVGQVVTDANLAAAELLRRQGYAPTETAWALQIRFDEVLPPAPDPPPGITIRPYEPERDDADAYRVIEDAFNEWPGRTATTFEQWRSEFLAHPAFAAERSPLAFDGDELVGTALYLDYLGSEEGWVTGLATRASHRRRGIARTLLHTAFRSAHASGKRACGLSTSSASGALGLYEKIGMRVRRSYTRFSKTL
jgi:mycothiol synthase